MWPPARSDRSPSLPPKCDGPRSFHVGSLSLTALHDARIIGPNDGKAFGLGVKTRKVGDALHGAGAPVDHRSRIWSSTATSPARRAPRDARCAGKERRMGVRAPFPLPPGVGHVVAAGHAFAWRPGLP